MNVACVDAVLVDFEVFEGFQEGQMVLKEVTVVDLKTMNMTYMLLKPPQNSYLNNGERQMRNWRQTEKQHGILWESGEIDYTRGINHLIKITEPYRFVYAKTWKKCGLLRSVVGRMVFNVEKMRCPPIAILIVKYLFLRGINIRCPYHGVDMFNISLDEAYPGCSYRNAYLIASWMTDKINYVDLSTIHGRGLTFSSWEQYMGNHMFFAVLGFAKVPLNIYTDNIWCTYCGFCHDSFDLGTVLRQHRIRSLLCHLKNYAFFRIVQRLTGFAE